MTVLAYYIIAMIYGRAGAPKAGQGMAAQVAALATTGAEKASNEVTGGARTDCSRLCRAIDVRDRGDILLVTRLDRLALTTRDRFSTLANIAYSNAGLRSLAGTLTNTTTARGPVILVVTTGPGKFACDPAPARAGKPDTLAKARERSLGRPFELSRFDRKDAIAASCLPRPNANTTPTQMRA